MKLVDVSPIAPSALPVDALKAHVRLGSGFAEDDVQDAVLEAFLRAALTAIEARTGKALITRAFEVTYHAWRSDAGQVLPIAPVLAISEMRRVDGDGGSEVIDPATYWLEDDGLSARLMPVGACLPSMPDAGRIEVDLTAGLGATWGDLPADLAQAVLLLAAHYYEYRDETSLADGCMPFGVTSLIARYRPVRLGGRA